MFVLSLSFLGWLILGTLAFRIGVWFVRPYIESTWAQLYLKLQKTRRLSDLAELRLEADMTKMAIRCISDCRFRVRLTKMLTQFFEE